MSDAHMVARDQLRSFIERIERLECEKKSIADDIKDVYGEAKGTGFDTKVLRKLISIRKQDREERMEQEAILDMYMIALGMVDEPAGYDEPRQSEPVERQPAVALRSDAGLNILTKHEDIRTAPATVDEICRPADPAVSGGEPSIPSTDAGGVKMDGRANDDPGRPDATTSGIVSAKSEHATNNISQSDDGAIAAVNGKAGLANAAGVEPPSSDRRSDQPEEGGADEVTSSAPGAGDETQTSNTGEGAANTALPDKPKVSYRPNCQHPENCASGTRDHCWSCRRAMQKSEERA